MPPTAAARHRLSAASLLALLLLGHSALPAASQAQAHADASPDFSSCSRCFFQETPPKGAAAGGLLAQCHRLPGGDSFASLHNPACGASVYSALRLTQDSQWGQQQTQLDDAEDQPDPQVPFPALLGGSGCWSEGHTAGNPILPSWEALTSGLVRQAALPLCSGATSATQGASLFVLTGATGLGLGEEEGCEAGVLWSAVCCVIPGESSGGDTEDGGSSLGFSLGLVKGSGEEERLVSLQQLLEATSLTQVFSGVCGEPGGDTEVMETFHRTLEALKTASKTEDTSEQASTVATLEETEGVEVTDTSHEEAMPAEREVATTLDENLEMENKSQESGSFVGGVLMYLLSSSASLLCAPLRPVLSTLTSLPGQLTYVAGEDLAALSAVPTGTLSLLHNMVCDVLGGMSSATGLVTGVGQLCLSTAYSCTSPLVGSLVGACYDGVAGLWQLTMDSLGIFGGMVDSVWSLSRFFGDSVWENSGHYTGTVLSELGGQVKTVGMGFAKLLWRGGRGVGNVAGVVGGLAGRTVTSMMENVKEAFVDE